MKKALALIALVFALGWANLINAGSGHQVQDTSSGSQSETMEHKTAGGTFTQTAVIEGVRAEFQVMSLKSMNIKDPLGNTHHVMVKFFHADTNDQIKNAVGKIKVINPSGKEQINGLKNYSGVYAANFTFNEKGKYGVICLFKVDAKKRLVRFWYPHG